MLGHTIVRPHLLQWLLLLLAFAAAGSAGAQNAPLPQPSVGDRIPAFDTTLLNGSTLSGKALAGRPLLVVLWATWCPTCRKELPELQKLYEKHRAGGFELLAVSIDAERLEVDEFWQDHHYTFPVAMRTPRHSEIFGPTRAPPRFFLIDRKGTLVFRHAGAIGYEQLEAALKPLL
ncbi:MAG: TlpA family protein disulfide reductase [Gammaproteobacteria bacterium]|nr:TlpA family protein disulfide reductase [Gammaproteobacteria bacterium]MBU1646386.1 TlpA family protein disulfide reductase [Gammaproteobacteria bacterium]MBU1970929.1 TlpA family protein disulfide reductase [Gammaproteobacteria bacterium]